MLLFGSGLVLLAVSTAALVWSWRRGSWSRPAAEGIETQAGAQAGDIAAFGVAFFGVSGFVSGAVLTLIGAG